MNFLWSWADEFLEFLEEQPIWSLVYFSVFYLGCTLTRSRMKQFWYDELATYYISRLPEWKTLLAALSDGADLNPPPLYFFTRLSHSIFGIGEVSTRLPATLGFLLMLLCLYRVIAFRTSRPVAFGSIFFPLITGAYWWAFEARPYGMMLGLVGAAVMFWQQAGKTLRANVWACIGLTFCLAGAVTTQAYAILAIGPFFLAEAVYGFQSRHLRWTILLSLSCPFAALICYVPLLKNHYFVVLNNELFRPEAASISRFFHMLLDPTVFPFLLVFALLIWNLTPEGAPKLREARIPVEELALAFGFLLVPVVAVLVGIAVTGIFFERYGLPAIIGSTLIVAFLLAKSSNRRAPVIAAVIFGGWCLSGVISLPLGGDTATRSLNEGSKLDDLRPDLPLVVSNALWFMPLSYYSEPGLANRLTYLFDRAGAVHYTGSDAFEVAYPKSKKWYGFAGNVEAYDEFMARGKPFLLLGPTAFSMDWVVKKLIADGATVRIISVRPEALVCEVTPLGSRK